jgi:hypothetical protein
MRQSSFYLLMRFGDGDLRGDKSPCGDGDGWKAPPASFSGDGAGKFFPCGDGDGKPFPDGEFPVAIPTLR